MQNAHFSHLQGCFNIVLPHSMCLPCLKTCNLSCVTFDDESARRLFGSCPVLEYLDLRGCHLGEGVEVLNISSFTLKDLEFWGGDSYQLKLNIPSLPSFTYVGPAWNEFSGLDSLKSMVYASVYYEQDLSTRDDVVTELVCSFCHVQQLLFSCDEMEAFIHSGHSLPKFNNLTRLTLHIAAISSVASRLLPDLLESSPRLEFLQFFQGCGEDLNELVKTVISCLNMCLRVCLCTLKK